VHGDGLAGHAVAALQERLLRRFEPRLVELTLHLGHREGHGVPNFGGRH
jgi:hypothetical protein